MGSIPARLPSYAPTLAAFHRACAKALRNVVRDLELRQGDRVIDVPCGDGAYLPWLAASVGERGRVVGVDVNPAVLALARARAQSCDHAGVIELREEAIDRVDRTGESFDVAWCAHSLCSLQDPVGVLGCLARLVKPRRGRVAVLENDSNHHWMLPWPPDLELAVLDAQQRAFARNTNGWDRFYVGRRLCSFMQQAGIRDASMTTYAIDHRAPLDSAERNLLVATFRELRRRAHAELSPKMKERFDALTLPESPEYLLHRSDFFATHLEILAVGAPGGDGRLNA